MSRVIIVGGGLTGLATAYYLRREALRLGRPLQLTVLEASGRWGGKIVSERHDGFLVEGGPDSFVTRKPWALDLIRELGLDDQVCETPVDHGRVLVLRDRRLVEMPAGMVFVVPTDREAFLASELLSEAGRRRVLDEVEVPPRRDGEDESLADFVRRRFGVEALERIAQPLMAGIHAADPERLSLRAAFPEMAELELRFGSLIRGLDALRSRAGLAATRNSARVSLIGGVGQLVDGLLARLEGEDLRPGQPVAALERRGQGFRLTDHGGRAHDADAVVLAVPAAGATRLVESESPDLATALGGIPHVSTVTVSLGFEAGAVEHPLQGLGFVAPQVEGLLLRACTWSSSKFPHRAPPGQVLLRAFLGGAGAEELVDLGEAELAALAVGQLRPLLGLRGEPSLVRVYRWPGGIPQYETGHERRVEAIEALCGDGLFLAGTAFRGLGLPDAVRSAQEAAAAVAAHLQRRGRAARQRP